MYASVVPISPRPIAGALGPTPNVAGLGCGCGCGPGSPCASHFFTDSPAGMGAVGDGACLSCLILPVGLGLAISYMFGFWPFSKRR